MVRKGSLKRNGMGKISRLVLSSVHGLWEESTEDDRARLWVVDWMAAIEQLIDMRYPDTTSAKASHHEHPPSTIHLTFYGQPFDTTFCALVVARNTPFLSGICIY